MQGEMDVRARLARGGGEDLNRVSLAPPHRVPPPSLEGVMPPFLDDLHAANRYLRSTFLPSPLSLLWSEAKGGL